MGLGAFGVVGYFLVTELTGKDTTHTIYSQAVNDVKNDTDVQDCLGKNLTGGGWRRGGLSKHMSEHETGKRLMRIYFHVQEVPGNFPIKKSKKIKPSNVYDKDGNAHEVNRIYVVDNRKMYAVARRRGQSGKGRLFFKGDRRQRQEQINE
ncbi:hypothetical protein HK096_007352 [Nowakowskiella sp. JEL0078]|nr:hypothetical protein HK096_007352 [Nowakowskiella sp. JEL0078]